MNSTPKTIHIWVPGIRDGSGGIQAFSRRFVEAVHQLHPQARLRVIIKNDTLAQDDPLRALPVTFHSVHSVPAMLRTAALVGLGIYLGLKDAPDLALTTHVHFLPALILLRRFNGTRCAAVLHGIEAWNLHGRGRLNALRSADRLMAVSHFTREQVISKFGVDPRIVDVVPNTFDAARYTPGPKPPHLLARFGLRPDQPVLLTVSRLAFSESYKGHRQVLYALPKILQVFPDARYIIGGVGDDLARLREMVQVLQLDEHVSFAGFVPGQQLPDFYQLCDVFVMPSDKEGFGIVFLEAMSAGKPVIAGNVDGSVDALDHGQLGVLVDPYNPHEIADAVIDVLLRRHPNKLIYEPEKLRAAVADTFGYERFRDRLENAMQKMAARQPADPPTAGGVRTVPVDAPHRAPRITVITQLTSPYQAELFNRVAVHGRCRLEVIYLTSRDRSRQWHRPRMAHNYIILDQDDTTSHVMTSLHGSDLVVFNNYVSAFSLRALFARARTGKPWVFWGERPGFLQLGIFGRWFRRLVLRSLKNSSAPIWGIGEFGIEGYRKEFGDHRSYWNIPYFSELTRFHRTTPAGAAAKKKVFLFSGSLKMRKGADIVARAFAKVAANRTDLHLIIMGEGLLEPLMRRSLSPVADQVTWAGFQAWDALPEFFHQADILCAPSLHDGWGLAVVEGLAAGLPVISTNRAGAALEFIRDGQNGWICPVNDVDAVERAMRTAADLSPDQLAVMSAAASASVAEHTLEKGAQRFLEASLNAIQTWKS